MRPLIGVLPLFHPEKQLLWMNPLYTEAVARAGGNPAVLHLSANQQLWEDDCDQFDGFVFPGGHDVEPALYGSTALPVCGPRSPLRDGQELYLLQRLFALDKPVLGICRGCQMLNVAAGGTLYQDLDTQAPSGIRHMQPDRDHRSQPVHQVTLAGGSRLHAIFGAEHLSVNSLHHQAIQDVAPGLRPCAWAEDGIVEAVEAPDRRFFLGVQWHPEYLPAADPLWQAFVAACSAPATAPGAP